MLGELRNPLGQRCCRQSAVEHDVDESEGTQIGAGLQRRFTGVEHPPIGGHRVRGTAAALQRVAEAQESAHRRQPLRRSRRRRCREGVANLERLGGTGQPAGDVAYHFDAARLVDVLGEQIRGERVDAHVTAVESTGRSATVVLEDGTRLPCDYVLDARGFPPQGDPDLVHLPCIPTNAALVQFASPIGDPGVTRNVARPHGWVFVIPLADRTGTGYVHDASITPRAEVEADYDALLRAEGITPIGERRLLRFPNFARRTTFDGAVMRVGNAASFTEPLEALSLGTAIFQLRSFTQWVRGSADDEPRRAPDPQRLHAFNAGLLAFVRRNAIFLGWHYSAGAPWETPFWARARGSFARAAGDPVLAPDAAFFRTFVDVARELTVDDLDDITDREQWNQRVFPRLRLHRPFGNFSELNVAQVGHGIGSFAR